MFVLLLQIHLNLQSLIAWLLVSLSSSASTSNYESHFHQHSGSDLDHVQCHHTVYKIRPDGGTPELVNGQESRVEPSRQYLPQPPTKKDEEAPAASFDQPNFLSVDNSFVSPSLQGNYNSLFSQKSKPDNIFPSAAQNVPTNILPVAPRISSDKKHSHEDDENNLERLCNDAFHSFLCKPITGPRKTPTGRLRPNAVIPPDVLAGLSSFQDSRRVLPDNPEIPSASNAVGQKYLPPSQPQPSNQIPQNALFLKVTTTTTRRTPTAYLPPAPFENILKDDKFDSPEIPSPSNTNAQVVKPHHDCEKGKPFTAPVVASPSNDNSLFVRPYSPSTPKPFSNYFNNAPSTAIPTNNVPKTYQPLRTVAPPHDCDKSKLAAAPLVANPSNNSPFLINSYSVPTPKPFVDVYSKPTTPRPTKFPQYTPTTTLHQDCDKSKPHSPSFVANPTNIFPATIKPYSFSTQAPTPSPTSSKPTFSYFNNDYSKSASTAQVQTFKPNKDHDCDKHKIPVFGAKTFQNTVAPKPYSQSPTNQFIRVTTESQKQPQPSNNIPQVIAQPQQINTVTVSPKERGYFYDKPATPFRSPAGSPTFQNPSIAQLPTQNPSPTRGYSYDQPRIPFPSDNVVQVVPQPAKQIPTFKGFPTTTEVPCEHHNDHSPSSHVVGNPSNQDIVMVKPNSYVYNKPVVPFPQERAGSSNQNPVSLRPAETSTGYNYDRPDTQFLLPNPSNNMPNIVASPANNGYSYEVPQKPFPSPTNQASSNNQIFSNLPQPPSTQRPYSTASKGYSYEKPKLPFPTSINSKLALASDTTSNFVAKPQNQVEVAVRPGYAYNKPSEVFETPQASNDNQNVGYSYPKPGTQFKR